MYVRIHPPVADNQIRVTLGDASVIADVADTEALRRQGLSGKQSLDEKRGMLFTFEESAPHAFWMKDMLFSIDIIWLDIDKHVIYIVSDATPESYPTSFRPNTNSRYVLEVPAGWAVRHGVTLGSIAQF